MIALCCFQDLCSDIPAVEEWGERIVLIDKSSAVHHFKMAILALGILIGTLATLWESGQLW